MTVVEFIEMFVDDSGQYFELWDVAKEEVVFKGYLPELTEDLAGATVVSIDNVMSGESVNGITLNIEVEE